MTPVMYQIRPAVSGDIDSIIALRTEAEEWLRQQGIQQWTTDYRDYARGILRAAVTASAAWAVDDGNLVIGTISFQAADPDFWDPEDNFDTALYPAKLIVARSHAGRQLGTAILNWASLRAQAERKEWLRIDVRRDNYRLHRYYLDQGWERVRTVYPPRRVTQSGELFQRPAGSAAPARSAVAEARDEPGRKMALSGVVSGVPLEGLTASAGGRSDRSRYGQTEQRRSIRSTAPLSRSDSRPQSGSAATDPGPWVGDVSDAGGRSTQA